MPEPDVRRAFRSLEAKWSRAVAPTLRSRLIEWLLWSLAVLAVGSVIFHLVDSRTYQRRARIALGTATAMAVGQGEQGLEERLGVLPRAEIGEPVAMLEIPRLDVSVVVAEGTTSRVLRRGVGRLASGATFGENGNVTLAGHRDTFFRPLADVEVGDLIVVESALGRETYEVSWTKVVSPRDVEVAGPTASPSLTLVTCYPFRYIGTAPERFVVRAERLGFEPDALSAHTACDRSKGQAAARAPCADQEGGTKMAGGDSGPRGAAAADAMIVPRYEQERLARLVRIASLAGVSAR